MSLIRTVNIPIAYTDASGAAQDEFGLNVVIPERTMVTNVEILRTTAWDAITTFQVGIAGDSDLLCTTVQANLTGAAPGVETVGVSRYFSSATALTVTWVQGGAMQGAGIVTIQYIMLR